MSVNTIFICSKCDTQFPKWTGRCLECGAWGTLQENKKTSLLRQGFGGRVKQKNKTEVKAEAGEVVEFKIKDQRSKTFVSVDNRLKSNFEEFDKVMGGGITQGSIILLGGDPGVGKSTLALQIAGQSTLNVLYISAEESEGQVGERLQRLVASRGKDVPPSRLKFLNEDNVETIIATINKEKPQLVVIDSIQTIYSEEVNSSAGSVNQVRACTVKLLEIAKAQNVSIILVGHVTKDGQVAGPKTMEHLVDTVLYLEGDKYKQYRLLRAAKNRFGPTDEVGILEMTKEGLKAVQNPSKIFLAQAHHQPGSVICAVAEGSQVFLVEVQALVAKTSASYPKRQSSGFDQRRLELLTTVITKRADINLANFDVYLNIAGGLTLKEPALDLAVVAAIISTYQNKLLPEKTVIFGEVGLAGEVRSVARTKERVKEAVKLGFKKIVLADFVGQVKGVELVKVKEVKEVILLK